MGYNEEYKAILHENRGIKMRKIKEDNINNRDILFIPAMLDCHFPLLKYAFYSSKYYPVILDNEEDITNIGLKYVNHEMCYPIILIAGQMIGKLLEATYNPAKVKLLMPTAGDACRGGNYNGVLKRAVAKAGFCSTEVLTLNAVGMDKKHALKITPDMVYRAVFGLFYGDILMLLLNQVRPYEKKPGAARECYDKWVHILAQDIIQGKHLTFSKMKQNFYRIAKDFAEIDKIKEKKQRIGLVGEIYIKYCHMGNWNMVTYLEKAGCETHTNGLSWYALYYIDSHLSEEKGLLKHGFQLVYKLLRDLQRAMITALREYDFYTLDEFEIMKKEAQGYVNYNQTIGDGWLIGAEAIAHIKHECPKVLGMQPFGCMPNHTCGRGIYPAISRAFPESRIVSIDVDPGAAKDNVYNRVMMLVNAKL